jgi:hypothetical protein
VLCTPASVRYRGEKLGVTIVACVSQSRPFLPLDCHGTEAIRILSTTSISTTLAHYVVSS